MRKMHIIVIKEASKRLVYLLLNTKKEMPIMKNPWDLSQDPIKSFIA